jgi:hypothetical protein
MDASFHAALTDIGGRLKIEGEDPRWAEIFRPQSVFSIDVANDNFKSFCRRLLINGTHSGNISQLFDQALSRLRQVLIRRSVPNQKVLENCCAALRVSALVLQYTFSSLPISEVSNL